MFMAFLCPEILKIKNANNYHSQISQIICSIRHTFMTTKKFRKLFYQNNFLSCYYWHRLAPFLKFWNEKCFWNNLPIIEKIPKWTPKSQKFENLSTAHKFYFDLGSHPVNECRYIYIYILSIYLFIYLSICLQLAVLCLWSISLISQKGSRNDVAKLDGTQNQKRIVNGAQNQKFVIRSSKSKTMAVASNTNYFLKGALTPSIPPPSKKLIKLVAPKLKQNNMYYIKPIH